MENGVKKTVSKYLGRVDPETMELMEKIPEKSKAHREKISQQRKIKILDDVRVGEYGQIYLLDQIQKDIFLGQDLAESFGDAAPSMLAVSMMLLQTGDVFDGVEGKMSSTWVRRYYGIEGSWDSGTLSRFTKKVGDIGKGNMERFFEKRISRNEGIVAWDTSTIGCYSDMDGMAEYVGNNKDNEDIKQVKLGFATDFRGIPLMYRLYPGNISDMETVQRLANDILSFGGGDCIFVMDRGFCSGFNTRMLMKGGIKFVMPATTSSKAIKKLLTMFSRTPEAVDMEHKGHIYKVWKTELEIVEDTRRKRVGGGEAYSFSLRENDQDGFGTEGIVTAYVCYDSKKYSDEVQNHKSMVNDLKKYAATIDSDDPVSVFKSKAGKAARYFNIVQNGRKVTVLEKRNSQTFLENRAGLFVMLTSEGIDWNTMMTVYDAREFTEQVFDYRKDRKRFGTSDKDRMDGMEFLRFVDLIMRCEISARIRESGSSNSLSVSSAISMAACIQAKEYLGVTSLSEMDRRQRTMFETLGVPLPREVLIDQPLLRPQA